MLVDLMVQHSVQRMQKHLRTGMLPALNSHSSGSSEQRAVAPVEHETLSKLVRCGRNILLYRLRLTNGSMIQLMCATRGTNVFIYL